MPSITHSVNASMTMSFRTSPVGPLLVAVARASFRKTQDAVFPHSRPAWAARIKSANKKMTNFSRVNQRLGPTPRVRCGGENGALSIGRVATVMITSGRYVTFVLYVTWWPVMPYAMNSIQAYQFPRSKSRLLHIQKSKTFLLADLHALPYICTSEV